MQSGSDFMPALDLNNRTVAAGRRDRFGMLPIALGLVLLIVALFGQVRNHEFLNYDDDEYVTANSMVRNGVTVAGVVRAFTSSHAANWHPLTWLSHMADCQLYGLRPAGHHVTNVLLHTINTLLLLICARRLAGGVWQGAAVALLFAIHPLHVESVAWVSERKDLIATLFWILAIMAYVRYAALPGWWSWCLVLTLFSCGLMAKPMVVTLPLVFLLLDWWPLGRWRTVSPFRLLGEKLPFFLLAIGSGIVTILAQKKWDALTSLTLIPLPERLGNIPVSYVRYLAKMFFPVDLAVFYPFAPLAWWQVAGALLLLGAITVLTLRSRVCAPWYLFGWCWFLVTLLPVIGIIQVGNQAMADRYTYIPLMGPFLMVVRGVDEVSGAWCRRGVVLGTVAAVVTTLLGAAAWRQTGYWRDSLTLFNHAIQVTRDNYVALNNLGLVHSQRGEIARGDELFLASLRANPRYALPHYNLGVSLEAEGRLREAEYHFGEAIRLKPAFAEAQYNLGVVLAKEGRLQEAVFRFGEAVRLNPGYTEARHNLDVGLRRLQGTRR
jgi:tetratricopeptide (TPR) repeat protein